MIEKAKRCKMMQEELAEQERKKEEAEGLDLEDEPAERYKMMSEELAELKWREEQRKLLQKQLEDLGNPEMAKKMWEEHNKRLKEKLEKKKNQAEKKEQKEQKEQEILEAIARFNKYIKDRMDGLSGHIRISSEEAEAKQEKGKVHLLNDDPDGESALDAEAMMFQEADEETEKVTKKSKVLDAKQEETKE
jgi:hypothetical protein